MESWRTGTIDPDVLSDIMKPDWYKSRPQTGRRDQPDYDDLKSAIKSKSSFEDIGEAIPHKNTKKRVNINLNLERP